jgi:hypothetical protein
MAIIAIDVVVVSCCDEWLILVNQRKPIPLKISTKNNL